MLCTTLKINYSLFLHRPVTDPHLKGDHAKNFANATTPKNVQYVYHLLNSTVYDLRVHDQAICKQLCYLDEKMNFFW